MVLQIEKPETLRLVEELTRRTGKSAEAVVESALREKVDRLREADLDVQRRTEIYALVRELQALVKESSEPIRDPGELLYGEDGLPR